MKTAELKKKNTQADLENVQTGKKTIRTLLKSQGDTGGMVNSIENTEKEIDLLEVLCKICTIYLAEKIVPKFKQEKLQVYGRVM